MHRRKGKGKERRISRLWIQMPGWRQGAFHAPRTLGVREARQAPSRRRKSKDPDNEVANRLARSGMRAGVRAWKMSGTWPCDVTPTHRDRYEVPSHFQCPRVDVLGDPVAALGEPGRI